MGTWCHVRWWIVNFKTLPHDVKHLIYKLYAEPHPSASALTSYTITRGDCKHIIVHLSRLLMNDRTILYFCLLGPVIDLPMFSIALAKQNLHTRHLTQLLMCKPYLLKLQDLLFGPPPNHWFWNRFRGKQFWSLGQNWCSSGVWGAVPQSSLLRASCI